ncbi:unnamed protein product [Urochloa decumbens]|uniref:Uncharacterized protein n=1 Tax=Urochloa decumbens TaxID=240449 RepID=A0ABC9FZQ3_9POAL
MILRRFVNIVAENLKGRYSLHRLDVSKHLFYPSTAEAKAAAAKAAGKNGNAGFRAPPTRRLKRLPPPCINFHPSPSILSDRATLEIFALLCPSSSEGRVLCCGDSGRSLIYNADSHFVQTMPSIQGLKGRRPITISTGRPGDLEDLYVLTAGADFSCFHVLRFGGKDRAVHRPWERKAWHWDSLPLPPFNDAISSYTVVDGGRTICVSSEAPSQMALAPTALTRPYHLCATSDLSDMKQPPTLQHVLPHLNTPKNWLLSRANLISLGEGKFCVAKVFHEGVDSTGDEPEDSDSPGMEIIGSVFTVLSGVELVTSGSSGDELEGLQVHKSVRYMFMEDMIQWEL